jgi:Protein of unknown function (DUF3723)
MNNPTNFTKSPVGIVRVEISSLQYESATIDERNVNRLVTIFTRGCFRHNLDNHVPALIRPTELDEALQASNLSREDLDLSLVGVEYPVLRITRGKLECLHGGHRLRAALQVLEEGDRWWMVRLYSFEQGKSCLS